MAAEVLASQRIYCVSAALARLDQAHREEQRQLIRNPDNARSSDQAFARIQPPQDLYLPGRERGQPVRLMCRNQRIFAARLMTRERLGLVAVEVRRNGRVFLTRWKHIQEGRWRSHARIFGWVRRRFCRESLTSIEGHREDRVRQLPHRLPLDRTSGCLTENGAGVELASSNQYWSTE